MSDLASLLVVVFTSNGFGAGSISAGSVGGGQYMNLYEFLNY